MFKKSNENSQKARLSNDFKRSLRHFAFYYTNGTLSYIAGDESLLKIDYREILKNEASLVEQAYAIFANVIEIDNKGTVLNERHAMLRAAQWIRFACQEQGENYEVSPPFEDWEVELH